MEQYLRAFCNYEQDNWVELLPLAEFAYNTAIHASTRMTPFWANYHYHPVMQFKAPKEPSTLNSEIQADTFAAGLEETHQTLRKNLQQAQANQRKYAGGKEVIFEVGDKVWLSTRHFRTTTPSKTLHYKRTGPYTVSKVINKNFTNKTFRIRSGSTTFSTSLCSTAIHLLPRASRHLNCSRRSSTTLTHGKSTESSTQSDATGSSIISYNVRVTVTYGLAGSLRRISGMRRSWSMSSPESIRGSLDDDWTGGMGLDVLRGFYFVYFLMDLGPVQMASARVFPTSGDK
jgi:hypothetical protein